jgi:protein-S-isoprenylcysteine O-methyltransferase Ste14
MVGFLEKHGIVRNAIRQDLRYFMVPAFVVMMGGLSVCGWDLVRHLRAQESQPSGVWTGSVNNYVGLALLGSGLAIMLLAQITLFRSYSSTLVIRKDHRLITHGIYRFVRHPIYSGAMIGVIFGIPIFTASLYGFLVLLLLVPVILKRIRMEEGLLIEEFGEVYQAYRESTRALVPFVF